MFRWAMSKKWIRIEQETHERLVELGGKTETFDEIIRRFLPPKTEAAEK